MTDSIGSTPDTAYTQFSKWLSSSPYWLQDAAWRIYNGKKIDDAVIRSYAEMCVTQAKKEKPAFNHLDPADVARKRNQATVSVLSLADIKGVNALADDVSLDFSEEGITVVYGLNGAGKSGFMRIFKQLSHSPYEEPIQPNVFKKAASWEPSCRVTVNENGEQKSETYKLGSKQKESLLSVIDVFDTRISSKYIGSENNVSYQPFVFTVLSELASIADKVSGFVKEQKTSIAERSVSLPKELISNASLEWVTKLTEASAIPAAFLDWSEEKQICREEIRRLLDTEKVKQQIVVVKGYIRTITPVVLDIADAQNCFSFNQIKEVYSRYIEAKRKLETAQRLFGENADEQDKISVDSADWKALWQTAQRYYEAVLLEKNGYHFAEKGSICPLCHQSIDKCEERFANVNEYINGTCSTDFKKAEDAFTSIYRALINRKQSSSSVKTALAELLSQEELTVLISLYNSFDRLKSAKNTEDRYTCALELDLEKASSLLEKKKSEYEAELIRLSEALKVDKKAELERELTELEAQKWVFENKDAIQRVIGNLKHIAELESAEQYLNTNRITVESNKLAEVLITDAYIERFVHELYTMAPNVKVKLEKGRSHKGNTPYRVSIDTDGGKPCKPEDILSEGEQRIVALAAFFADATGRDEYTPIIIDDPISSLDIRYENSATKRIIELAHERQVIVFTHRISMLIGLQEEAKNQGIKCEPKFIRSSNTGKGVPDLDSNFHGNLVPHLNELRSKISRAKKQDSDSEEYEDIKGRICQQFRACIERSVEAELLQGTVERFRRSIVTKDKVKKLSRLTDADCEIVEKMMTKYSFTEHPQPIDSPPFDISYEELDDDIGEYVDWINDLRKRMKQ